MHVRADNAKKVARWKWGTFYKKGNVGKLLGVVAAPAAPETMQDCLYFTTHNTDPISPVI